MSDDKRPGRKTARGCPICSRQPVAAFAPFCSKRCADVDLHRWLKGGYAIPAEEPDEESETADGGEGETEQGGDTAFKH
ncbi:MAG TPA: DNA gyrase inhibitor YacG [Candidatus Cybelea sp.]|nr:DNA gyrase inhibitor YacG [Candidatus Cybelea sp.]